MCKLFLSALTALCFAWSSSAASYRYPMTTTNDFTTGLLPVAVSPHEFGLTGLTVDSSTNLLIGGYVTYSGLTNRVADNGSTLTYNGTPFALGSGAPVGTVVNSGTPTATAVPTYADTTGTNLTPSQVTIGSLTNFALTGKIDMTNPGYGDTFIVHPTDGDGFPAMTLDTPDAHTTGNLVEVATAGSMKFTVKANSGYTAGGTKYLADDGYFKAMTNIAINATDSIIPYRTSSTAFGDSPWYVIKTNALGFGSTNRAFHSTGSSSIFIGQDSGNLTTTGLGDVGLGTASLSGLTSGYYNVGVGYNAGLAITGGYLNTAVGTSALLSVTTAGGNTGLGASSGRLYTGFNGVFVGANAGYNTTTGTRVTAVGATAGYSNIIGSDWVAIGSEAGRIATNIDRSVIIGSMPLQTGENEQRDYRDLVYIGHKPLTLTNNVTTVTNSIYLGSQTIPAASNVAQIGTNGVTVLYLNGTVGWFRGSGSPESAVTAPVGSFYSREDGGASTTFYVKESGTGNTGWVAK